jgi:anthranilate phosphoribosyltransferase
LADLGTERAFVVHGNDGLDEITTTTDTYIAEVNKRSVATYSIRPEDFGITRALPEDLTGGEASDNVSICLSVLSGEKGPKRDVVVLNSAFAICAAGFSDTPNEGIKIAEKSIDSGAAMKKIVMLRKLTNS